MADERTERRLAAILSADIVGYSRLMGIDEAGTLAALKSSRKELIDPSVADHKGRIVKLTGDGILVEFPSAVGAVACALAIQHGMNLRNGSLPHERRIDWRIGVNVGDIIVEDGDIFGDGVNVATRLEGVAQPGGICVSASVYEHVGNRLDITFEDVGDHALKNIDRPIRVFRVHPVGFMEKHDLIAQMRTRIVKPVIAVLPFSNISGDSEQDYFADGITEDLITDLSKVSGLSVIARHSVFTYKGKAVDVTEVSRRFNAATVLEGSVRRLGQRVRFNAQLIDGKDGTHLWADRYDHDLTDIFAVQDEIVKTIVEQLKVRLLPAEKAAIEAEPTQNLDAYNCYLQGRQFYHLHSTHHALLARRLFRRAIELDPSYARAYSGLADCGWLLTMNQHEGGSAEEIMEASMRALALDPSLAEAHASHAIALLLSGRRSEAFARFEEAVALDPNLYEVHYLYAYACRTSLDRERSAFHYQRAAELAPDDYRAMMLASTVLRDLGRTEEWRAAGRTGIERAERALKLHPEIALPLSFGSAILAALGEPAQALEWAGRAITIASDDPLTQFNVACTFALLGDAERSIELLEKWVGTANKATLSWLTDDTDFDGIREHPRFKALQSQLRSM